jgi:hypothetical protein
LKLAPTLSRSSKYEGVESLNEHETPFSSIHMTISLLSFQCGARGLIPRKCAECAERERARALRCNADRCTCIVVPRTTAYPICFRLLMRLFPLPRSLSRHVRDALGVIIVFLTRGLSRFPIPPPCTSSIAEARFNRELWKRKFDDKRAR